MFSRKKLAGKVALVTGGSRGIGAAIVKRLTSEGARVAFTYPHPGERGEAVARATNALAIEADSADPEAVIAAVERTARKLGRLDILVNNAGAAVIAPIDEMKLADIDRMLAINLRAVVVAIHAALKHMKDGGRIINIGSSSAERIPFPGASVYGMTKAALQGLVKGVARDVGRRGITINNIQPGPTDTETNPANGPESELLKNETALGRFASVDEIAGLVAYLVSDEAGYITGASLTIDGGFSA